MRQIGSKRQGRVAADLRKLHVCADEGADYDARSAPLFDGREGQGGVADVHPQAAALAGELPGKGGRHEVDRGVVDFGVKPYDLGHGGGRKVRPWKGKGEGGRGLWRGKGGGGHGEEGGVDGV